MDNLFIRTLTSALDLADIIPMLLKSIVLKHNFLLHPSYQNLDLNLEELKAYL